MDAMRELVKTFLGQDGAGWWHTGKEDTSTWTREMLRLVRCAHVFDVVKCKIEYCYLDEAGESRGNDLGHEHCSGRDLEKVNIVKLKLRLRTCLHVVPKLEIRNKAKSLWPMNCKLVKASTCPVILHCNVSVGLEDHHGKWSSRLDISKDELGKHVQTDLSVCDGLDYPNRQREYKGDSQCQRESPPC